MLLSLNFTVPVISLIIFHNFLGFVKIYKKILCDLSIHRDSMYLYMTMFDRELGLIKELVKKMFQVF